MRICLFSLFFLLNGLCLLFAEINAKELIGVWKRQYNAGMPKGYGHKLGRIYKPKINKTTYSANIQFAQDLNSNLVISFHQTKQKWSRKDTASQWNLIETTNTSFPPSKCTISGNKITFSANHFKFADHFYELSPLTVSSSNIIVPGTILNRFMSSNLKKNAEEYIKIE